MSDDSTELPSPLRSRLTATPLWDFALVLYGRPGVEAACLHLQDDAGVDVTELLWRCWLYHHGLVTGEAPEAVSRWQAEVTTPLRRLRRALKDEACHREGVAALRERLKASELDAEREALLRLEEHSLAGHALCPLSRPAPGLQAALPLRPQLQKKSHLFALRTLESQLDPS